MAVIVKIKTRQFGLLSALISMLALTACQTAPMQSPRTDVVTPTSSTVIVRPTTDDDYPDEPYTSPTTTQTPAKQDIITLPSTDLPPLSMPDTVIIYDASDNDASDGYDSASDYDLSSENETADEYINAPIREIPSVSLPSHSDLLERARQNSQQQSSKPSNNQSDLPAFRNLMSAGINHLKNDNLSAAESSFTRAQRVAPKSSAVYFYLSQVALKKNQPRKAEAMARRGLAVSQDTNRRRSLWQLILRSGQMQNNSRVIREAQQALR